MNAFDSSGNMDVKPSDVKPSLASVSSSNATDAVVVVPNNNDDPDANDDYTYECDADVVREWNESAKDNVVPLIAMIRQLCFFTDLKKITVRTYTFYKDDIVNFIGKVRRRPSLQIDVSDIAIHDHPHIYRMYRNMQSIIGMHRTSHFMVRVEHAFDNSQITSEYFVVSRVMKIKNKPNMLVGSGIDSVHHIVLPINVQLKNIGKIPPHVRTIFHHISYSVQPIVFNSQTLDTWFKRTPHATNAQLMDLCIQMAEALTYLHDLNVVHGDVKPGNTLVKCAPDATTPGSLSLYVIDFGMSGCANFSEGTGGTRPFCAPETGNGSNVSNVSKNMEMDIYNWTKVQKHHDVWSMGLMFMTMIAFRKSYVFPKEYPSDFFEQTGHINPEYFNKIQNDALRNLFKRALSPAEERITAAEFLTLARSVLTDVVDHIPIIILGRRNNRGDGQTDNGQTDNGHISA
jgi:serine/threonine protein kinase